MGVYYKHVVVFKDFTESLPSIAFGFSLGIPYAGTCGVGVLGA